MQESANLNWASKARRAICKSHKSLYIGDGPGVLQRFRNLAPPRTPEIVAPERGRCSLSSDEVILRSFSAGFFRSSRPGLA